MRRIRILIADGSSITRQTLRRLFDLDPELEVVGATAAGRSALAQLVELKPDVVLLDVAEPDREGLKTLAAVRETHPALPVLMFSRLTGRGSQTTLDALQLGASDYVTKPDSNADLERCVRGELIKKIKSLAASPSSPPPDRRPLNRQGEAHAKPDVGPTTAANGPAGAASSRPTSPVAEIVAIASSTGGPNALASLLSSLPPSFLTPIVIVQHMASGFTTTLAESLRRQTGRNVCEVEASQPLQAASAWLAPGGRHLVVSHHGVAVHVAPNDDPPENACCPSADVLFRSVADVFGSRCLGVVLTGMGYDGLAGCRAIRRAGGQILVQDEATSVAWGMPGQVATAGLADGVLPLTELSREICQRSTSTRAGRAGASQLTEGFAALEGGRG